MLAASPYDAPDAPGLYDAFETSRCDFPLWLALGRRARTAVLELGAGTGRVSWALAVAGIAVVALERAAAMRAAGRRKAEALPAGAAAVTWLAGDMRRLSLGRRFDLVIAPARVFEELLADGERERLLAGIARHLVPGGCLALHLSEPPAPDAPPVAAGRVSRVRAPLECIWQETLDRAARVRRVSVLVRRRGSADLTGFGPLQLRWSDPGEVAALLERSGLRAVASWRGVDPETLPQAPGMCCVLAVAPADAGAE